MEAICCERVTNFSLSPLIFLLQQILTHHHLNCEYNTDLHHLEDYIDDIYNKRYTMGCSNKAKKPRTPTSAASDTSSSPPSTSQYCSEVNKTLLSIDQKLGSHDSRVALVEVLHKEFQQLRHSLEYSQQQIPGDVLMEC